MVKHSLTEELRSEMELLDRTVDILTAIKKDQPIGINTLSERLEIESHKVRYSLRLLEKESIIEPTAKGAMITDKHEKFEKELIEELREMENNLEKMITALSE
ncbi:MAG: hypothetical protein KGY76_09070 [Candidatus Thermoplasmatota archaeon]|nr:hypothetical protein [Candidatus Thermoplasmatota archaeon]